VPQSCTPTDVASIRLWVGLQQPCQVTSSLQDSSNWLYCQQLLAGLHTHLQTSNASRASAACTTQQTAERRAAGDAETVLKHAADNKQQKRSPRHHKQDLTHCQSLPPQLGTLSGAPHGLQPTWLEVQPPRQLALRVGRWWSTVLQNRRPAAELLCSRAPLLQHQGHHCSCTRGHGDRALARPRFCRRAAPSGDFRLLVHSHPRDLLLSYSGSTQGIATWSAPAQLSRELPAPQPADRHRSGNVSLGRFSLSPSGLWSHQPVSSSQNPAGSQTCCT